MLSNVTAMLPGQAPEMMVAVQRFANVLQNPRAPCIYLNVTWQKVQLIVDRAVRGDAAHSSRNGERYSQMDISPEHIFCVPEDRQIIKTAFMAVGQV